MHSAEFELSFDRLSDIRKRVEDWTGRYNDKRLSGLVLITSEVVTNLLKHSQPKATVCKIEFEGDQKGWSFRIYDNGGCFNDFLNKQQQADELEFGELLESGMGLGLVSTLSDSYSYCGADKEGEFNCYHFQLNTRNKTTIAIIDDDPSILVLLEAYLGDLYRLLMFDSGEQALKGLVGRQVDLVISDLNMPEIDGLELRKLVKGDLGNIPFIFLTGENPDHLYHLAIDDVLSKPIKKQDLLQSVERVLVRHTSLQQSISQQLSPTIVNQLLPKIKHEIAGYQLLIAARAAQSGGGDFIFQKQQQSGCLFLMADVMGHDQQAKFFVHAYQGFLQGVSHGLRDCVQPEQLLYALSEGLQSDDLLASSLLTAVSAYCSDTGEISVAVAGHPAPKVLVDNQWQDTPVSGQLLGFSNKAEYHRHICPAKAPVLLYTDGLSENLSATELDEFLQLLTESISQTKPSLSRAMDYYDNKAGIPAVDDMTLLVIIPQ